MTRALSTGAFPLFAEMIVVSLTVAVLSLVPVAALSAFAAGAMHIRRHVEGEDDSVLSLARDFVRALRGAGWAWSLLSTGVVGGAIATMTSPLASAMPGIEIFRVLSAGALVVSVVVLLRAAAMWRVGARWSSLVRIAAARAVQDFSGSLLLLLAVTLASIIVWMFAPLVILAPGMLGFAAYAVEARRVRR